VFDGETLKWFARGFLLTSLVLLMVAMIAWPPVGWAQGGGEEDPGAETEGEIGAQAYSSPLVISAADFSNTGTDPDGHWFSGAGGYVDGWGTACLKAPAYLPDGATVDRVWATVYDNDAANDINIYLRRVYYTNPATMNTMATVSTSGTNANVFTEDDSGISNPDVVYPDYSYYLYSCLDSSNTRIYAVRIYYN
jgi:hypothetical protein